MEPRAARVPDMAWVPGATHARVNSGVTCGAWGPVVTVELDVDDLELLQLWKRVVRTRWMFGHSLHEGLQLAAAAAAAARSGGGAGPEAQPAHTTVVAVCKLHKHCC